MLFIVLFAFILSCVCYQIGIGNEVSLDELMDVASEPYEFNIYLATNFSALTQNIVNRLTDAVCNSKCPPGALSDFVMRNDL